MGDCLFAKTFCHSSLTFFSKKPCYRQVRMNRVSERKLGGLFIHARTCTISAISRTHALAVVPSRHRSHSKRPILMIGIVHMQFLSTTYHLVECCFARCQGMRPTVLTASAFVALTPGNAAPWLRPGCGTILMKTARSSTASITVFITTAATSKSADELLTVHVFEHEPAPGLRALLRGSVFVLASYKWS